MSSLSNCDPVIVNRFLTYSEIAFGAREKSEKMLKNTEDSTLLKSACLWMGAGSLRIAQIIIGLLVLPFNTVGLVCTLACCPFSKSARSLLKYVSLAELELLPIPVSKIIKCCRENYAEAIKTIQESTDSSAASLVGSAALYSKNRPPHKSELSTSRASNTSQTAEIQGN